MIIETSYKSNDTVTIKIAGGEEVVARFVEENDKTITVTKPLALMAAQQGIGLGPWCFTVDPNSKIKINKDTIVFVHKTEDSMAKQYITSTSGLSMI